MRFPVITQWIGTVKVKAGGSLYALQSGVYGQHHLVIPEDRVSLLSKTAR
jgi:hypothetical protein